MHEEIDRLARDTMSPSIPELCDRFMDAVNDMGKVIEQGQKLFDPDVTTVIKEENNERRLQEADECTQGTGIRLGMPGNKEILGRFNETILFKYNVDKFKSEDKFISVHMFETSDDVQDDEKDELYAKWIPMVTEGACDPEKAVATPKQVKKTRKSMDDIKIKPKEEKKEAEVEPPIRPANQNRKEPKPKEEKAMPKSKKEILLEAISALEEDENTGMTESRSKRYALAYFVTYLKVIDSMQSSSMALLNQIKMDEES